MSVRVQADPFDMGAEVRAFTESATGAGAVVTFSGLVRDEGGTLSAMEIEHYPGMTEKALGKIRDEAMARWSLADALVIHRFGPLKPGEQIMMVATASRHRKDAFEAAEFLMDYLKSRPPFLKKDPTKDTQG
ncbi:MAG: molybdenum cofactor biosynthesis protein MoaE, partial [Paracoccaceae bacterium]